jgi:hypothetical protein
MHETPIDYTADEFTILEIRVGVVDLVEPQVAGLVGPIAGPEDSAAQVLFIRMKSCTLTLIGPIDRDGIPVSTHVPPYGRGRGVSGAEPSGRRTLELDGLDRDDARRAVDAGACRAAVPMPPGPMTTTVSPSRTLARWTDSPRGEPEEHLAGAWRVEIDVLDRPRCTVFMQYRGAGLHQPSGVSLRGPAFRGPLSCWGFRRAGGEPAQGGDAWNRGHRLVDVITSRDECFQLGQQCIHRPDHRIGESEISLGAVERSVEALGGRRQILHKVRYLTCELERSGWDTHRSTGDRLRGVGRRLRGSPDVFRARNLLALHMTTMPYAGTTVWDLPGATSRSKLIFLIDGSATILAGGTVRGDEME